MLTRTEAGSIVVIDGRHVKSSAIQNDPAAARHGTRDRCRRVPRWPLPLIRPNLAPHVALGAGP